MPAEEAKPTDKAEPTAEPAKDAPTIAFSGFSSTNEFWLTLARAAEAKAETKTEAPWHYSVDVDTAEGLADPLRFMGQICAVYNQGEDPIADPFAAFSAIPAATGVMRARMVSAWSASSLPRPTNLVSALSILRISLR